MTEIPVKTWSAVPNSSQQFHPKSHVNYPTRICQITDDRRFEETPTEYDTTEDIDSNSKIQYEDKYVKITEQDLYIKNYYFPTGIQKRIALKSVSNIKLLYNSVGAPKWGIDLERQTWWAHDYLRNEVRRRHSYLTVTVNNEILLKGFTVKYVGKFLDTVNVK